MFTTRPLSKIELLKLKAKDLIFYLQSKHISTTGCVGECTKEQKPFFLNIEFSISISRFYTFWSFCPCRKRRISKFGLDSCGQFDKFLTRFAINAHIIFNGHGSKWGCPIESIRPHTEHVSKSIFNIHRENCGRWVNVWNFLRITN